MHKNDNEMMWRNEGLSNNNKLQLVRLVGDSDVAGKHQ